MIRSFVVTLAFASHSTAGDATVLSYAYLFASYLVAGTVIVVPLPTSFLKLIG